MIDGNSVILKPGTPEYKTALEQIYGKPGVPDGYQPVLDWLGRKIKEEDRKMPVPREETDPTKRVMVFRDHILPFPELHLKVAIIGPPHDTRGFPSLFARAYCQAATDIYDADLVVFTGGPDVDPVYYHEEPHATTAWDEERDSSDISIYLQCYDAGIPMAGVCRGAQFLAVMNGAKLFQDIDNHNGDHSIFDNRKKETIPRISSVHHQCVRPCNGMEVIAYSHVSTKRWKNPKDCLEGRTAEVEAFYFRDTCSFGVQGHPEYKSYNQYAKWFLEYLDEFVNLNEDIELRDGRRRLEQEFIDERTMTSELKTQRPMLTCIKGGN